MGKLNVDGTEIQVLQIEEDDYISLTDMICQEIEDISFSDKREGVLCQILS